MAALHDDSEAQAQLRRRSIRENIPHHMSYMRLPHLR